MLMILRTWWWVPRKNVLKLSRFILVLYKVLSAQASLILISIFSTLTQLLKFIILSLIIISSLISIKVGHFLRRRIDYLLWVVLIFWVCLLGLVFLTLISSPSKRPLSSLLFLTLLVSILELRIILWRCFLIIVITLRSLWAIESVMSLLKRPLLLLILKWDLRLLVLIVLLEAYLFLIYIFCLFLIFILYPLLLHLHLLKIRLQGFILAQQFLKLPFQMAFHICHMQSLLLWRRFYSFEIFFKLLVFSGHHVDMGFHL